MNPTHLALADDATPLGARPLSERLPDEARLVGADYVLLELLGQGGMGEVWRARQLSTGREVAVKLLRRGRTHDRFAREVAALARLEHPGIVRLLQAGQHEGRPFLVLELVSGSTLADHLKQGPMEPRAAAQAIREAAEAMASAHALGVVHRDLKPSNLLLDSGGRARVADFGLAKDLTVPSDLTVTGDQLGTPSYMAPEQVDSKRDRMSAATDVYGLGATLYHALTGVPPFAGLSTAEVLRRVGSTGPDWNGPWRKIHRDLRTICARAMHQDAGRRYAGAAELAADLARFLAGEPIHARPVSLAERSWRTLRKPWPLAMAGSLAAAALSLAMVTPLLNRSRVDTVLQGWPQPPLGTHHVLSVSGIGRWASFSDDGALFAAGGEDGRVRVAQVEPWLVKVIPLLPSAPIHRHQFQPGGRDLLTVDTSGLWRWWQTEPLFQLRIEKQAEGAVTAMAFSPDGRRWAVGSERGEVTAWGWSVTNKSFYCLFAARHEAAVTAVQFLRTDHRLLTASEDGSIKLWDIGPDTVLRQWSAEGTVTTAALSPDETLVAATFQLNARENSRLRLYRLADGAEIGVDRYNARLEHLRFSPDGGRLTTASSRRWAQMWDAAGQRLTRTGDHADRVTVVEFSPDGLRLLTVDADGNARLWDAHTGEPLTAFWRGNSHILQATFSPDGLKVGSGDAGPVGTIWDASCPLPHGWDGPALVRALLRDGRLAALRRAAWLAPKDATVWQRLAELTAAQGPEPRWQQEAEFLRRHGARLASVVRK